ncbi:class I SAM-dependent methyltransferase [Roseobacter sp. GAI101]|uniref:class I SAM-dependent methyltransferase n=1 Tax=Roseobacter sp. (strain GAI101) TaxID=391589 RepID=UPI0001871853|nr:class I SAM-dependent methyltransferase [Roseobacter sp. GAI101]EEB86423.1 methyltransferase, UbiE/COQ5 family [Roseobacter sp. GAI101]
MAASNQDQEEFWTSNAGPTWVSHEGPLDLFLGPVLDQVLERSAISTGQHVLDIGCGTGQSTLAAGNRVGPTGHVLGLDISSTMIARANERVASLPQVALALADAAEHLFEPAFFDHVISRFGVMFFADPEAAFRNIARALKPGGKVTLAAWGQIQRNPWFTLPAAIAKAELGAPPKSDPDEPGPFAFRDIDKVCSMLVAAGFTDVGGVAQDMVFALPGGMAEVAKLSLKVGPAAGTIKHFSADQAAQDRIEAAMADAFEGLGSAGIPAEINFFTATKS